MHGVFSLNDVLRIDYFYQVQGEQLLSVVLTLIVVISTAN
jgi:hypothetical protein